MRKLISGLMFAVVLIWPANALASCSVSVSPNNVVMGISNVSRFSVTNTGEQLGNWVRFQSPGLSAYTVANMTATGWYPNGGGNEANFAGGYLEAGTSSEFNLTLAETGENISSMDWEALVSYDAGETFESCGTTTIQVVPAPVAPVISNISLTVGNSSAVISWNTNLTATGTVNYGTSSSYGGSANSVSGTTHSVGISGLNASTTYHYQIQSSSIGGTSNTNDATFTTSAASVTTTTTTTVTNTVTNTATVTKVLTDSTPPVVKINNLDKAVFESAPLITGSVSDDRGVAKVEFRIKGREESWSSAGLAGEVGAKKILWEFLPPLSLDGSYEIEVRGVDVFGNVSPIKTVKFVIDQLMPSVGGGVISYGAIPLEAINGSIELIEGREYEVVLHETGGADEVSLVIANNQYSITKMGTRGLWRGLIKIEETGEFISKLVARDGAGNLSEREWVKFSVKPRGRVLQNNQVVESAVFQIFVLDPSTKRFRMWEEDEYGINVEKSRDSGIGFVLPKGEYYLQTEVEGHKIISQKMNLSRTTTISGDWEIGLEKWWEKILPIRRLASFPVSQYSGIPVERQLQLEREKWIGKKSIIYIGTHELPWYSESLLRAKIWAEREGAQLVVLKNEAPAGLLPQVYFVNDKGDTVDYKEGIWER